MYNSEKAEFSNFTYADKDFGSIYPDLLDLARKLTKKWDPSASNESDPGVVLLKEGAFLADHINYNTDKNILEGFLPTATQESSVRNLVQLGGYLPNYYVSAYGKVSFYYDYKSEDEDDENTEETEKKEFNGFTIPTFTLSLTDSDGEKHFVQRSKLIIDKNGNGTCNFIEGHVEEFRINDDPVITIENLEDNRLYLPVNNIPQNGVFIKNKSSNPDEDWGENLWQREEYLNVLPGHTKCYRIEFDSDKNKVYIEFPDDVDELIESGILLKYIVTTGSKGNIPADYLSSIESPTEYEEDGTTYSMEKFTIKNNTAFDNGKDPETIEEMYHNFKEVVGTFDTLVTCRDYSNFIKQLEEDENPGVKVVSNAVASDCTNDYDTAVNAVTYDKFGKFIESGTKRTKLDLISLPSILKRGDVYISGNKLYWYNGDSSVEIKDFNQFIKSIEKEGMGSGDIKLCALMPFSIYNYDVNKPAEAMEKSFKPIQNRVASNSDQVSIEKIQESLEEYKCISTSFEYKPTGKYSEDGEGDLFYFRIKTPLSIQVITYEKITSKEVFEGIKHSIYIALSKAFNSSQLEFGENLNRDELYQTIIDSDERIKNVYITEGEPKTCGIYVDPESDEYIEEVDLSIPEVGEEKSVDLLVDLISKNVLAGRLCLFNFITDLEFNYGQKDVTVLNEVVSIKTDTMITPKVDFSSRNYTDEPIIFKDADTGTPGYYDDSTKRIIRDRIGFLNLLVGKINGSVNNRLISILNGLKSSNKLAINKDETVGYSPISFNNEYYINYFNQEVMVESSEDGTFTLDDYIIEYNSKNTLPGLFYHKSSTPDEIAGIPLCGKVGDKSAIDAAIDKINSGEDLDLTKSIYISFLNSGGVDYDPNFDYSDVFRGKSPLPAGQVIITDENERFLLDYNLAYNKNPGEAVLDDKINFILGSKYTHEVVYRYIIPEKVENHYIYIARPNFVEDEVYPTYCYYRLYSTVPEYSEFTIPAGVDTVIDDNYQLDIWYKKDNAGQIVHLRPGTIVNSTFDISTDDFEFVDEDGYSGTYFTKTWSEKNLKTNVNQTFSSKFKMIPTTGTISTKSLLETKLDSKINCYWIRTNPGNTLFEYDNDSNELGLDTFSAKIVGADNSEESRICTILNNNEYFIYTNQDKTSFALFGPGTMLSLTKESLQNLRAKFIQENVNTESASNMWSINNSTTIDSIYQNGITSDIEWAEIDFRGDPLYITEMNISVLSEGDTLEATLKPKEWNAIKDYTSDELNGFSINTNWQPISNLNSVSYISKEGDGSNITSVVDSYFFKTEFILQDNKVTLNNHYIINGNEKNNISNAKNVIDFQAYSTGDKDKDWVFFQNIKNDSEDYWIQYKYYSDLRKSKGGPADSYTHPVNTDVDWTSNVATPGFAFNWGNSDKWFGVPLEYVKGDDFKVPVIKDGQIIWENSNLWKTYNGEGSLRDVSPSPGIYPDCVSKNVISVITEEIICSVSGESDSSTQSEIPLGCKVTSNFNFAGTNSSLVTLTEEKKKLLLKDPDSTYKLMYYYDDPWKGSYKLSNDSWVSERSTLLPDYNDLYDNYDILYLSFKTTLYDGENKNTDGTNKEIDSSIAKESRFKVPFYYYNPNEFKYVQPKPEEDYGENGLVTLGTIPDPTLIIDNNYQYIIPILISEADNLNDLGLILTLEDDNGKSIKLGEFGKDFGDAIEFEDEKKTLYLVSFDPNEFKEKIGTVSYGVKEIKERDLILSGKSSNLRLVFTWNTNEISSARVTLQPIRIFDGINKNLSLNAGLRVENTLDKVLNRMNKLVDNSSISGTDIYYINEPENDMAIEDVKIINKDTGCFNPQFLLDKNNIANRITLDTIEITNDSNEVYLAKPMRGYRE